MLLAALSVLLFGSAVAALEGVDAVPALAGAVTSRVAIATTFTDTECQAYAYVNTLAIGHCYVVPGGGAGPTRAIRIPSCEPRRWVSVEMWMGGDCVGVPLLRHNDTVGTCIATSNDTRWDRVMWECAEVEGTAAPPLAPSSNATFDKNRTCGWFRDPEQCCKRGCSWADPAALVSGELTAAHEVEYGEGIPHCGPSVSSLLDDQCFDSDVGEETERHEHQMQRNLLTTIVG